jgi:hypothetical protein
MYANYIIIKINEIYILYLYFNIYHILVYKHNDFLLHYADKVHLLIRKEIMN